ncbi:hypothetical protein ACHAXR_010941 [Thalassiosira sp. AJA248-18]
MRARRGNDLASNIRLVQKNSCGCATITHDATKKSLALIVLIASLYTSDALSLPGRRLFRRHATCTSTELEHDHRVSATSSPYDEESDLPSSSSPAFTSALFTSPTYRRHRSSRQRLITQHRRQLFRREERNFQLNYKEHDDDLLAIIESQQPLRGGIFRWRKRKSLSKALFPPLEDEECSVDGLVPGGDPLDMIEDNIRIDIEEDVSEMPMVESGPPIVSVSKPIGIGKIKGRKKKQNPVVVTNINELHEAILDRGLELRDVELKYSPPPSLLKAKWKQRPSNTSDVDSTLSKSDGVGVVFTTKELDPEHSYGESYKIDLNAPGIELEDENEPNADEWQLIGNVLAEESPFSMEEEEDEASAQVENLFSHDVLNLLHQRYHSQSTPMSRAPDDTAILALSIEGGGMRGAVSGGMAAAIACLGLSNAFDTIYGSSAGSIIGSYFVTRQLYLDVYTDVIPAGKDLFVSKSKIFTDIFRNMFYVVRGPLGKRLNANLIERFRNPVAGSSNATQASMTEALPPTRAGGLNISFVLDTIMCPESGLRPLDLKAFAHNDAVQPLRIVSSAVELETGRLKSICFGSKEGHFRDQFANPAADQTAVDPMTDYLYPEIESAQADENGNRRGLWAALGASMTVPGAAGSPFRMDLPSSETNEPTPHLCFDAFCYEPVPFRAAVAEGATHVLALRSRPAGYEPKTKPTLYERAVAPLYFRSNGVNTAAEFFEKGGQQYLYAEDVLICDQGLNSTEPIPIPPAKVLYANPAAQSGDDVVSTSEKNRENWARAHLLPITVPADVPELLVLSQDRDDILEGIRSGFAAAYDALAPVVGLEAGPNSLDGMKVAELVFPEADAPHESVLEKQFQLAGEMLGKSLRAATEEEIISASSRAEEAMSSADLSSTPRRSARLRRLLSIRRGFKFNKRSNEQADEAPTLSMPTNNDSRTHAQNTDALMSFLPGVQLGSLPLVAERLQTYLESHSFLEA